MAEFYNTGESIDGDRVLISVKKYVAGTYTVSPTGFKGIKYKCYRDGKSSIEKSLTKEQIIVAQKNVPSIHTDVGDTLKCNRQFFIAESKKRLTCFNVTMMSGRHECNEGQPDVRVYAEIEAPFASIVKASEKKLKELQAKTSKQIEGQVRNAIASTKL